MAQQLSHISGQDEASGGPAWTPAQFLQAFFGTYSDEPIFLASYGNRDAPPGVEGREVMTRSPHDIEAFVRKNDVKHRACYFGVATIRADAVPNKPKGSRRNKDNVAEIICLHTEIDLKGVLASAEEVLAALDALPCPPSVVVFSGNGFHVYWLLSEKIVADVDAIDLVEDLNQALADLVGGDVVRDVTRLLRIPGTHNSKDGAWKEVRVVRARFEPRYELGDVQEMVEQLSPVIRRKPVERPAGAAAAPANPFAAHAAALGYSVPVDVDAALAQMGQGNIHSTMLSVSAALLHRGLTVDEVVERVMPEVERANRAAGNGWNDRHYARDERKLLKMCADWSRKHPAAPDTPPERPATRQEAQARIEGKAPPAQAQAKARLDEDNVVSIVEARTQKQERAKPKAKPKADDDDGPSDLHVKVGSVMLARLAETGQAIAFSKKGAYHYQSGVWIMEVDGLKAWLDVRLQEVADGLGIVSTNRLLSEARGWIIRQPSLWRDKVEFDAHGLVPTQSGLLDPRTLSLTPARPEHYCTWTVATAYDPAATCPVWEQMLSDTFADRAPTAKAEVIGLLQEILGAALLDVKPRGMSRALVLVGGSNYGKSGVLDVLSGLFGDEVNSTPLDGLDGTHGLMGFMQRRPWVLHEAFDQAKWHTSSTVKAIVTGDPIAINIKNGPILSARIRAPIFWGTNSPPQFKETSMAIVNRLAIVPCRRLFDDRAPIGAALLAHEKGYDRPSNLVLATERAGLLNWALAGLQRALTRGAIAHTEETDEAGEEMHRDSNLAAGFVSDCIEFDPDWRVSVPDFCAAFASWYAQEKGTDRFIPSNEAIGKALIALSPPGLAYHPAETRDKQRRYYCGVKLNAEGEAFWRSAKQSRALEGKMAGTTPEGDAVNTVTPSTWLYRDSVARMRARVVTGAENGPSESGVTNCHPAKTVTAEPVTPGTVTGPVTGSLSPPQAVEKSEEPFF